MKLISIKLMLLMVFIIVSCKTGLVVYEHNKDKPKDYIEFVNYYLPKTIMQVKVPINMIEGKAGLMHKIKDAKLSELIRVNYGIEPVNTTLKEYYLGDNIVMTPIPVIDDKKCYTISYKDAKALEQTIGFKFSKEGYITSGEFAQESKTFEYVTKGVELSASVIGKLFLSKNDEKSIKLTEISDADLEPVKRAKVLINNLSMYEKAKYDLITKETAGNSNVETAKFRIKEIDKNIAAIKKELIGYKKKTTYWLSFEIDPQKDFDKQELLYIHKQKGIKPAYEEQGILKNNLTEIYNQSSDKGKLVEISAKLLSDENQKDKSIKPDSEILNNYLFYNIPARYSIQLFYDDKPIKTITKGSDKTGNESLIVYFPQLGEVSALPAKFKELSVVFYEDIGAIKEVKFSKKASANSDKVQMTYASADSLISLRQKYIESKEEDTEEEEESEEAEEQVIRLIIEQAAAEDAK